MSRIIVAMGGLAAICALSAGLAGCGKLGSLERPGPMFGRASNTVPPGPRQDPNRPVQTVDPRDPNSTPGQDQPAAPDPAPRTTGPQ